ncbi:hypothetical protein BDQ17DRAFT_1432620 [Cyathus striatus]|nr:hypothetical protein BDQ17DRAFT_1432620 [Cyathus striatus]
MTNDKRRFVLRLLPPSPPLVTQATKTSAVQLRRAVSSLPPRYLYHVISPWRVDVTPTPRRSHLKQATSIRQVSRLAYHALSSSLLFPLPSITTTTTPFHLLTPSFPHHDDDAVFEPPPHPLPTSRRRGRRWQDGNRCCTCVASTQDIKSNVKLRRFNSILQPQSSTHHIQRQLCQRKAAPAREKKPSPSSPHYSTLSCVQNAIKPHISHILNVLEMTWRSYEVSLTPMVLPSWNLWSKHGLWVTCVYDAYREHEDDGGAGVSASVGWLQGNGDGGSASGIDIESPSATPTFFKDDVESN